MTALNQLAEVDPVATTAAPDDGFERCTGSVPVAPKSGPHGRLRGRRFAAGCDEAGGASRLLHDVWRLSLVAARHYSWHLSNSHSSEQLRVARGVRRSIGLRRIGRYTAF